MGGRSYSRRMAQSSNQRETLIVIFHVGLNREIILTAKSSWSMVEQWERSTDEVQAT